jgi:hypothetical protein
MTSSTRGDPTWILPAFAKNLKTTRFCFVCRNNKGFALYVGTTIGYTARRKEQEDRHWLTKRGKRIRNGGAGEIAQYYNSRIS